MVKKGFTMVELLAVIAILGILGVIGGISVFGIVGRTREQSLTDGLNSLKEASISYVADKKYYLKACSSDFDPKNPTAKSSNNGCYRLINLNDVINEKLFDKKNLKCNNSKKIVVYRISGGSYTEIKCYLEDGICTL